MATRIERENRRKIALNWGIIPFESSKLIISSVFCDFSNMECMYMSGDGMCTIKGSHKNWL